MITQCARWKTRLWPGLAKTISQGTVKGRGREKKRGGWRHQERNTPGVRQVSEGSGEQTKWRKLVVKSSVMLQRPSLLRDRWRWEWKSKTALHRWTTLKCTRARPCIHKHQVCQKINKVCQKINKVCQKINKVCQKIDKVCQKINKVCQKIDKVCQKINKVCQKVDKGVRSAGWTSHV